MKKLLLATMLMLSPVVAIAGDISPISQSYYQKAISLYNAGNVSQAKNYMLKVIDTEPNFADAYFNLGVMYKNANIYETAIKYLQKAIALNSNDNEAKYQIAICFNELQDREKAINYLTSIPTKDKNYKNVYNLLSQINPEKYPQTKTTQIKDENIKQVNFEQKTDVKMDAQLQNIANKTQKIEEKELNAAKLNKDGVKIEKESLRAKFGEKKMADSNKLVAKEVENKEILKAREIAIKKAEKQLKPVMKKADFEKNKTELETETEKQKAQALCQNPSYSTVVQGNRS